MEQPYLTLVNQDMTLKDRCVKGRIDDRTKKEIVRQALCVLKSTDPLLYHICKVRLVCNPRRNYLTFYIDSDYETMIYHKSLNGIYYCFFISAKIEPFVIITAVCPLQGKLVRLTEQQLTDLSAVLEAFKKKYGIVNETYHYTELTERNADVVHSGNSDTKAHSAHFHLKMRIATQMMSDMFPVLRMINLPLLKEKLEPVQYCFSRACASYETTYQAMLKDVVS